ncbi:hypothetical protein SDC9_13700 [bioreactor metagenome]|uniref:Uncharacterized protein n=1 Tax=bioreactor metagenome TaxID=1076179 RepID=A0A644TM05_9ZZZZ
MVLRIVAVQSIKDYKREPQPSKEGLKRKKPNTFANVLKTAMK